MELQNVLNEFLLASTADGLSENTVRWYRTMLLGMVKWIGAENPVEQITTTDLRKYIVMLRGKHAYEDGSSSHPATSTPLSDASISSHITALHRLFNWSAQEYGIDNPMARIKRQKIPPREPKRITQADWIKLFHATRDDLIGARDRALLCMFADTGARLAGIASLSIDDIESGDRAAYVTEKGKKSRWIYWTHYTQAILMHYVSQRLDLNPALWISANDGRKLTSNGIYQILKRLKSYSGVRGRANPHAFRHGFAYAYITGGGDIATLARLMGHASVDTTAAHYLVFAESELQILHNKRAPLAQWLNVSIDPQENS